MVEGNFLVAPAVINCKIQLTSFRLPRIRNSGATFLALATPGGVAGLLVSAEFLRASEGVG